MAKTRRGGSGIGNEWLARGGMKAKKTGKGKGEVKQAVKRAGPSRKKVENDLGKSSVQVVALYS